MSTENAKNFSTVTIKTNCGMIRGIQEENCNAFLGVRYATAGRFEYAVPVERWEGTFDATEFGSSCPQYRMFFPHLEERARAFYQRELREGIEFTYSEDCLNCNIYAPKEKQGCHVIVFIHGGSFDSNSNRELPFRGESFAALGIVTVFINYRVGILGYLTSKELCMQNGRDGNFGLDDQITALKWVKKNICDYGGDGENMTVMGQSAGAMSIQYLCCSPKCAGLFRNAVMMSGGGKFPNFSLPKFPEKTRGYWESFMGFSRFNSISELKGAGLKTIFSFLEEFKRIRTLPVVNTMPVVDGFLLPLPIKQAIRKPLEVNYLLGYTNSDMFAPLLAFVGHRYARKNNGYIYFFDVDAKGDKMKAFHSSDLRYMFGTLHNSWRPYDSFDQEVSSLMQEYIANFARSGNPNATGLPLWERGEKKALRFAARRSEASKKNALCRMQKPPYIRLLWNALTQTKLV